MRKLLFIFLLFPQLVEAQRVELGINGGMMFYKPVPYDVNSKAVSFSMGYSIGSSWQVGASVANSVVSYQDHNSWHFDNICFPTGGWPIAEPQSTLYRYQTTQRDIGLIKAFVLHKFRVASFQLYTGVSGGYAGGFLAGAFVPYSSRPGNGWTAGMQHGANWYFSRHWGLNLDIAANYTSVSKREVNYDFYASNNIAPVERMASFSWPMTLGIHFRF